MSEPFDLPEGESIDVAGHRLTLVAVRLNRQGAGQPRKVARLQLEPHDRPSDAAAGEPAAPKKATRKKAARKKTSKKRSA